MRPQVVAHRGASHDAAEHTLAAYERAVAAGADALECDVRLTADGHLVCLHDRRVDRTSDGRGVVATRTLADLERLDFGSWHDDWSDFEAPPARNGVLTLSTLLELVVSCPRPLGLAVETKHPSRYGALVEQSLVALLDRFGLARPPREGPSTVRVMSFSEVALRRLRAMAPGVPRVLLLPRLPVRMRTGQLPYGTRIAGPSVEVLRRYPGFVARARERGTAVHVWTVDAMADVDLCADLGVDAVITNRPAEVIAHLASRPTAGTGPVPGRPAAARWGAAARAGGGPATAGGGPATAGRHRPWVRAAPRPRPSRRVGARDLREAPPSPPRD